MLYVERLAIGQIGITLTAQTAQLAPMNVSAHRAPLSFAPLTVNALRGSGSALGRALLSRYASDALAASPALLGSLQLLGNPTWLLRSVRAGLSDALILPLAGARQGPRQFVAGLGAGASSLLQHVSHGALTSVSDFASAVATTLNDEPSLLGDEEDDDAGTEVVVLAEGSESHYPSATRVSQDQGGGGGRSLLYGAVRKPVGGALQLVSAASQSLMHTVSSVNRPSPSALPSGLPLPRRASAAWCVRALFDAEEAYLCHALVHPVGGGEGSDGHGRSNETDDPRQRLAAADELSAVYELLLSSGGLYLLRSRRVLLALPSRHLERLEASPPPPEAATTGARRVLAVFVAPSEAARLGLPSCLQYSMAVHAALGFAAAFTHEY